MNPENEHHASNKIITLSINFRIINVLMFALMVSNAKSDEISSLVTHHQVEISGFEFIPKQLKVNVGDTITWTNKDVVPHNIIDDNHHKVVSPDLATGESFTFVINKSMLYECGLHPSMKGKLSLIDSP